MVLSVALLVFALVCLVRVLRELIVQRAEKFINNYLFRNDFTAFVLGLAITVLAQSSSVTTSLIVPLLGAGVVTLYRCYPYTLGANIGTTCTALLASFATVTVGEPAHGVTAAFAHLIFNILGIAIFYPLRIIPITMARRLADAAVESKRLAIGFVIGVFFAVPLVIIVISRVLR